MVELPRTRGAVGGEAPALLARLRRGALRALAAGTLYRHSLIGRAPEDLRRRIGERWPGESATWHPIGWRSDVLATRVFTWIVHLDELAGRDTDRPLRRAMLGSLAAQLRHLARIAAWESSGAAQLRALKGLLGGFVALGGSERRIARVPRVLERGAQ